MILKTNLVVCIVVLTCSIVSSSEEANNNSNNTPSSTTSTSPTITSSTSPTTTSSSSTKITTSLPAKTNSSEIAVQSTSSNSSLTQGQNGNNKSETVTLQKIDDKVESNASILNTTLNTVSGTLKNIYSWLNYFAPLPIPQNKSDGSSNLQNKIVNQAPKTSTDLKNRQSSRTEKPGFCPRYLRRHDTFQICFNDFSCGGYLKCCKSAPHILIKHCSRPLFKAPSNYYF